MKPTTLRLDRLETRLAPALATWDGGGADNKWTTAANWVGDVAPHAGDDLVFPAGAAQLTNVNDFPTGTAFGRLTAAGGYQLSGNGLSVSNGVGVDAAAGTSTLFLVPIGGSGGLTKTGAGTLSLRAPNTYTGVTTVAAGVVEGNGLGATGPANGTTVADGATLILLGPGNAAVIIEVPEAVTISGDGVPLPGGGRAGALRAENGSVLVRGAITLAGNARFGTGLASGLVIQGDVGETGGPRTLTVTGTARFAGTLTLTGGIVVAGSVLLDGQAPGVPFVLDGGTLRGTGRAGTVSGTSGVLQPGLDFELAMPVGGLDLDRGPTTAATYSVKFINGAPTHVDVTGAVRLGDANLAVVVPAVTVIAPAHRFTIITNDGTDPVIGTFAGLPETAVVQTVGNFRLRITYRGGDGNEVQLVAEIGDSGRFAVGAGAGGRPLVNYYNGAGTLLRSFLAYDASFRGGVRVATGDVTGGGVIDIITAPGPGGGPHVKVYDGVTFAVVRDFMAYDPAFTGGLFVAVGQMTSDLHADIITGAGAGGGPHVKVFDGATGATINSFFAYDAAFHGGVSVAGADAPTPQFGGSIITGAGPGGGPHVRVFNSATGAVRNEFFAYDPAFRGGVNVATHGPFYTSLGNTVGAIVTAPASQRVADIRLFNAAGQPVGGFAAYDAGFFGGASVAVKSIDPGGAVNLVTGAGPGGGPHVKVWRAATGVATQQQSFFAFDPAFRGGVFVG